MRKAEQSPPSADDEDLRAVGEIAGPRAQHALDLRAKPGWEGTAEPYCPRASNASMARRDRVTDSMKSAPSKSDSMATALVIVVDNRSLHSTTARRSFRAAFADCATSGPSFRTASSGCQKEGIPHAWRRRESARRGRCRRRWRGGGTRAWSRGRARRRRGRGWRRWRGCRGRGGGRRREGRGARARAARRGARGAERGWEALREGVEGREKRVLAWWRQERRKDRLGAERSLGIDTTVSVGFECSGSADKAYSLLKHSTNTRSSVTRSVFLAKGRWNTG